MSRSGRVDRAVLVVEDEHLVALLISDVLRGAGYRVIGPVPEVARALDVMAKDRPDAAVLDVQLRHERIWPVADALAGLGIPFVFVTGYGSGILPPRHRERHCMVKPFLPSALLSALHEAMATSADADAT